MDRVDQRIIDLNKVGVSLSGIGRDVGLHHSTVKLRLLNMGIDPVDTRRSFMEDIFNSLRASQQDALIDLLRTKNSSKEYIRVLITDHLTHRNSQGHSDTDL